MKYVVDASVLLVVGRGTDWVKVHNLGMHRRLDLAVPEPVIIHTAIEVRNEPSPAALRRWTRLISEMPRMPWTTAVSEKVLTLDPPSGIAVDLDAITAAHALACDATLLTMEEARYEWIRGLKVEEL